MKPQAPSKLRARDALGFLFGAVFCVVAANVGVTIWMHRTSGAETASYTRKNLVVVPVDLLSFDAPSPPSAVLLMGNSHTYGLPALKKGNYLRDYERIKGTVGDELAGRLDQRFGADAVTVIRLACPNYVPLEMLIGYEYLRYRGIRPQVVVLGWSWPNFSRTREVRPELYSALRDRQFVSFLDAQLSAPALSAGAGLLTPLREEESLAGRSEVSAHAFSLADMLDSKFVDLLDRQVPVVEKSASIQVRIMRGTVIPFEDYFARSLGKEGFLYPVVPDALRFNISCMKTMLRAMRADGARVLIYYAPTRGDIPTNFDEHGLDDFKKEMASFAKGLDFPIIDASRVVPDDAWGWEGFLPDRVHFMEAGHRRLAALLWQSGLDGHVWDPLKRATSN